MWRNYQKITFFFSKQKTVYGRWFFCFLVGLTLLVSSQWVKYYLKNNYFVNEEIESSLPFLTLNYLENKTIFFGLGKIETLLHHYLVVIFLAIFLFGLASMVWISKNFFLQLLWLILFVGSLGNWLNRIWNDGAVIDYLTLELFNRVVFNLEDLYIYYAGFHLLVINCYYWSKKWGRKITSD